MADILVRLEARRDAAAVRSVEEAAFPTAAEANLVETLKDTTGVQSWVALIKGEVVGHVLYTPVGVHEEGSESWQAIALGPVAVLPAFQGQGVGTWLIQSSLRGCLADGHDVVFVLGHPEFYTRLGFRPANALGLRCRWPTPDNHFMVSELRPGALGAMTGAVTYHTAFDEL